MKKYLILALVLVGLSVGNNAMAVVGPSQGPSVGSSFSNQSSGLGNFNWINTSNVLSSNNQYATSDITSSGNETDYLKVKGFGFSIPAGSTINGIVVSVEKKQSCMVGSCTSNVTDNIVRLVKNNFMSGSDKADTSTAWGTTDFVANYGNSNDLWGTTWSVADINNSNFGVNFSAKRSTGGDRRVYVDHITITVYYTPLIDQTITVTTNAPANAVYNSTFSVAATGGASGNPVVITTTGGCTGGGNDSADITMTSGTTSCVVHYNQAGNISYNPAPEVTETVIANKADATINVTGFTGTYDSLIHGATGTATGVLGESLSGLDLGSSFRNVPGGTANWTFTDVTGNYNDASGSVDIIINARDLNVIVTGVNKIYDGNTSATVILGSDKIPTDDVTLSYSSASFDTADSGADKVVTVDGIAISGGADAGNYNLVTPPTSTTANISPEAAIISLNGSLNVDYDGASHALTASTNPEGKSYVILYNGSTNDPVNAGSYSVFAQITDPNYAGQITATLVINKINQSTLTVTGLPEGATYGQSGITASTAGGNGEGAVTFSAGESSACSVDSVTGVVTITSGTGTCAITATKAGDVNYNETTSEPVSVTISKANQTITFAELGDKTMGDPDFGVTATSDSELPVTFTIGEGSTCSILEGNMIHLISFGTCTVIAHQSGDDNYNSAEDLSRSFTIAELTHTITVTFGSNGTISPSGSVIVADGSDKTFTITPANGYHVLGVKADGSSVGAVTTYTFTEVTSDHSIEASFAANQSQGGGGGGAHGVLPVGEILGASTSVGIEIAGCGMRTTGYSTISGVSCEKNKPHSEGEVLGAEKFIFTQYMRRGLKRTEVPELQKRLTTEGFYAGLIDGKFGPLTDKAVRAYQKANPPLKVDGIVGPLTRAVLNK